MVTLILGGPPLSLSWNNIMHSKLRKHNIWIVVYFIYICFYQEGVNTYVWLACITGVKLKEKVEGGGVIIMGARERERHSEIPPSPSSFKNCPSELLSHFHCFKMGTLLIRFQKILIGIVIKLLIKLLLWDRNNVHETSL